MNANFTPNLNGTSQISSFRHWCQKVLPIVYDDSLSYYELLCKMTTYLNKVIENSNSVGEDVENLHIAYEQLENYVNNYIENIDFEVVQTAVDNWLDKHPEATTSVQDGSIGLDQLADEVKNNFVVKDFITPEMYGAVGDGVTDDSDALQMAIDKSSELKKPVLLAGKTYLIEKPLIVGYDADIRGCGIGRTYIRKNSTTTVDVEGASVNTIFVTNGRYIKFEDLCLEGNEDEMIVSGFTFGKNTANFTFNRLHIKWCEYAFNDLVEGWIGEFTRIHCVHCLNAFYFFNDHDKTTYTFKNCWAENCGLAYMFKRMVYSSLINCAADWCNCITDNPYGKGYGDETTGRGVYMFESCRGVAIIGCGCENCYGNGMISVRDCNMTIDGLVCWGLKSKYTPDYTNYPNYGTGIIHTTLENSVLNINNVECDTFVNEATGKPCAIVAHNYWENAYGAVDRFLIKLSGVRSDLERLNGHAKKEYCLDLDTFNKNLNVTNTLCLGNKRTVKTLTLTGNSNQLVIPIKPFGNYNVRNLITITGINDAYNSTDAAAFKCTVAIASLQSVVDVRLIEKSNDKITASGTGSNLVVTLPDTYTRLIVGIEIMGSGDFVEWTNTTLGTV